MEAGDVQVLVPDAPYIQNYMGTGEECPEQYNPRLERERERLLELQEQLETEQNESSWNSRREELIDFLENEIADCKRNIEYYEGIGA